MANDYTPPEFLSSASQGMQAGYSSGLAIEQAANKISKRTGQQASRRGAVAGTALSSAGSAAALATSIAAAAGAANAVPIAGQVAAAGLAVAALLTKIFAGRRQRKRAEAARKRQQAYDINLRQFEGIRQGGTGGATGPALSQGPVGNTAPVFTPQTPAYSGWNGQQNPAVQSPTDEGPFV